MTETGEFLPQLAGGGGPCEAWWRGVSEANVQPLRFAAGPSTALRARGGEIVSPGHDLRLPVAVESPRALPETSSGRI